MNPIEAAQSQKWYRIYFNPVASMYWGVHVTAVVGLIILGWSWSGFAWAVGMYFSRMFMVTGVLHRYFSHRTYKTSRFMQFLLGLGCATIAQKGPLWWAHHHRHHHRRSDMADDLHSPSQGGFWWSHMGWFLAFDFERTDYDKIKDFAKYPELRWLNRYHVPLVAGFAVLLFLIGGTEALMWGFFVSTVFLWHGTFTINSLSHVIGRRRYDTSDKSRNHWLLALITMGEGWHNNHHHYQSSCRQGFRWYEIDMTYYILRLLAAFRLIWDIRTPPEHIVANRRKPLLVETEIKPVQSTRQARSRPGYPFE
ncbi:MAG: acyl-CoA desaturase [Proteobacteria bacterium]|nr:acyl-CoA desaturase [Pseudomonadota bacterium]